MLDWQTFKANPGRHSTNQLEGIIAEFGQSNFGSFPDAPVLRLPGADALLNFTAEGDLLALRDGQLVRFDIEHGGASGQDADLLLNIANNMQGNTICALADAAAMPIRALVTKYRAEFEAHIAHGTCPLRPGRAPARPATQHAHA